MGRANGASVFAECGLHDCYARATRPPFKTVETLPQGNKQRVVGIRYATADHDDFRVEDINEAADGGRQRLDRCQPDFRSLGRALLEGFDEVARGLELTVGALHNIVFANGVLQAAGSADDVWRAVRVE